MRRQGTLAMEIALFVTFLCCFGLGIGLHAWQIRTTPSPPAPASAAVPTLSEDDTLLLQTVQKLGKVAADACQGLESVKVYNAQRQAIAARLDSKYPGFTLDWVAMTMKSTEQK